MPNQYTSIGPWTFQTFTLFIALAVIAAAIYGLRRSSSPDRTADVYLVAVIGGLIGARVFHMSLNWDYFAENLTEAFNIALGGLDWHGAVIGGVMGLWVGSRIRTWIDRRRGLPLASPHYHDVLDPVTLALPVIGLAGWWGCLAALCGYGLEVDNLSNYPAFAVSETADVYGIAAPRYNTQLFGLLLSAGVFLIVIVVLWRGWLRNRRFWLTLALLSTGMFVIGFFRGDHVMMVSGLRGDQLLDVMFVAIGLQQSAISYQQKKKAGE